MSGDKRKVLKRATAQGMNHLANGILDINIVYEEFEKAGKPEAELLKAIMENVNACRDMLIQFAGASWQLDEDGLKSYL